MGRRNAGIRADEELFELLPDLIIKLRPVEETGDAAEPPFAGAFERLFGLFAGLAGAFEDAEQMRLLWPAAF